jgi:hypothetical protein
LKPQDNREEFLDTWLALTGNGPSVDHPLLLPVLSGSMLPEIPMDAVIHIQTTDAGHCHPGDVIVYREGDRLVVHRLLMRLGLGSPAIFYEKGDANAKGGWIRARRIRGLVIAIDFQDGTGPKPLVSSPGLARSSMIRDIRHRALVVPRRIKQLLLGSSGKS